MNEPSRAQECRAETLALEWARVQVKVRADGDVDLDCIRADGKYAWYERVGRDGTVHESFPLTTGDDGHTGLLVGGYDGPA